MVRIYPDYADEPADTFLPLPDALACDFYRLEMDAFQEDVAFYQKILPDRGSILEMGCGTGRVASQIAHLNRQLTGIDISMPMLQHAIKNNPANCQFFCMDMVVTGFRRIFDALIIPYNTLNLLIDKDRILSCLKGCRTLIHPDGYLLAQLFVATEETLQQGKTTFQFQMFNRSGGGRIIKEILKRPQSESQTIEVEERFRVRPMQKGLANADYHTIYRIAALPIDHWLSLFAQAGFSPENIWGSYDQQAYAASTTLCLVHLKKNLN